MKPNVILINCDDLGFGDLSCYGSKINSTPTIDELAHEGRKFNSFYAASSICSPSRAALLTGCLPPRVGITRVLFPGEADGLNKNEFTLPQMFKNEGYSTMIVGKWHCGDQKETLPLNFGFDDYFGLPFSNDMGIQKGDTDLEFRPPLPLMSGNDVIEEQPDQTDLTQRYVEKSIDFINKNSDKPFFLYLAHMHVHLPLYAKEQFLKSSRNGDFGACVSCIDWATSEILTELKRLGIYENTLIIFTSDNGSTGKYGASNFPLKGTKFTAWEGGFRVPFIAHWKNKISPGEVESMASNIDILPTLASLIGADLSENEIDGVDISQLFLGEDIPLRETFVYYCVNTIAAVRKGDFKLHVSRDNADFLELYNLKDDLCENNNIASQHPEKVAELMKIVVKYQTDLGDALHGYSGAKIRKCTTVPHPQKLTHYDENHKYIISMYDKTERG